jgi:hypothetical protein
MARALREGLGFVWTDALILPAISLDLFAVLFGGATALLPIYAAEILHAGARGLGWLRAAPSIGAISMAFLMAHLPSVRRAGRALLWAVAGLRRGHRRVRRLALAVAVLRDAGVGRRLR